MNTIPAGVPANRAKNEDANRNLASMRPCFIVKDLQASITHYRERLGFQLDFEGPDDGPFWAGVSRDRIASCSRPWRQTCRPVQTTRGTAPKQ